MKNKILRLFVIAVTGICCLFAACKSQEPPSLNAPENVRVENGFLVWDKVKNAEKYIVYYKNKEHETVNNFFDLATITEVGEYLIEILAVGDGNQWIDSSWSTYNYTLNHIDDALLSLTSDGESRLYFIRRQKRL